MPHDLPHFAAPSADAAALARRARLIGGRLASAPVAGLYALVAAAQDAFEAEAAKIAAAAESPPLACAAGCAGCCHQYDVAVSVPEVLALAEAVRATLGEDEIHGLRLRLVAANALQKAVPSEKRDGARIACPLLFAGVCSVHPARPFACRAVNSFSRRACEQAEKARGRRGWVPGSEDHQNAAILARDGLRAGLRDAGLAAPLVGLYQALPLALDAADATARWQAGDAVFAEAELTGRG